MAVAPVSVLVEYVESRAIRSRDVGREPGAECVTREVPLDGSTLVEQRIIEVAEHCRDSVVPRHRDC